MPLGLSIIVDLAVFLVLWHFFDVDWIVAFIAAEVSGWTVRAKEGDR